MFGIFLGVYGLRMFLGRKLPLIMQIKPQNPSKPHLELRYDLGTYNFGLGTPKPYHLKGKVPQTMPNEPLNP